MWSTVDVSIVSFWVRNKLLYREQQNHKSEGDGVQYVSSIRYSCNFYALQELKMRIRVR